MVSSSLKIFLALTVLLRAHPIHSIPASELSHQTGTNLDEGNRSLSETPSGNALPNNTLMRPLPSYITVLHHTAFRQGQVFCRIHGACRRGDGIVLLPEWMSAHSDKLSTCGLQNISFTLRTATDVQGMPILTLSDSTIHIKLSDSMHNHDLFGNVAPRGTRELLATDITPHIAAIDIFRRSNAHTDVVKRECLSADGNIDCAGLDSTELAQRPHASMLVDSRVADTKDYLWPKSLLRLVRNSLDGKFDLIDQRDLYGWRVRSHAACFRSILSTNVHTSQLPATGIRDDHIFFSKSGLSRVRTFLGGASCTIKVLILNRVGRRFIAGADALRSAIVGYGNMAGSGLRLEAEVVLFENSSFHEQVSVLQESDIVVGAHGEGLANVLFARRGTNMFEIVPFGGAPWTYASIARAFGLQYERVWSQGDDSVFSACVNHFNTGDLAGSERFLTEWRSHADAFRKETIAKGANTFSSYVVPGAEDEEEKKMDGTGALRKLRECTQYQRLSVDVKELARRVVRAGGKQCGVTGELKLDGR